LLEDGNRQENHFIGMVGRLSTSLQIFARNIGTAIGVTLMGAFVTGSSGDTAGAHAGMHGMFTRTGS
jgi:hypothetical protein